MRERGVRYGGATAARLPLPRDPGAATAAGEARLAADAVAIRPEVAHAAARAALLALRRHAERALAGRGLSLDTLAPQDEERGEDADQRGENEEDELRRLFHARETSAAGTRAPGARTRRPTNSTRAGRADATPRGPERPKRRAALLRWPR